MSTITVKLTDREVRAALMYWAVTHVLNEGEAVRCDLECLAGDVSTVQDVGTVEATIEVATPRQSKPLPTCVVRLDYPEPE